MADATAPRSARGPDRRRTACAVGEERRYRTDRRRHGYLAHSPLFNGLPYDLVERVVEATPVLALEAGEVLLEPGQSNDRMYLVLSGRLEVHIGAGENAELIPVGAGGTLGELSIIDGQPVSARVSAAQASVVVPIPAQVFWEQLLYIPGFGRNFARVLSARMRSGNERIVSRMREHLMLEHLHKELQIARSIQAGMLPGRGALFGDRRDLAVYGLMDPARDIGGDLYDAFLAGPDHLVAVVGDVSGKGIPAALFMARVVAQLRLVAMSETAPAAVLERLNRLLCEHNDAGMFVTLLYLVLDLRSGEFRYSNAGHNPPALVTPRGCEYLALPRGMVAGMVAEAPYAELRGVLPPGGTLLLYTDGVTEAANRDDELYGEARLAAALAAPDAAEPGALVEHVRRSVDAFAADAAQSDDITMLAISRPGC